jgi:ribosome-associated protein
VLIDIAPGIAIEERHLTERFVRSSGPGGQNVNKVATAVELRFDVDASALPRDLKARLRVLAGSRLGDDGVLVIDSRAYRTQLDNREAARERLIALLRKAAIKPKKRRPTKPSASARESRIQSKKRRSELKSLRRRGETD